MSDIDSTLLFSLLSLAAIVKDINAPQVNVQCLLQVSRCEEVREHSMLEMVKLDLRPYLKTVG